MGKTTTRTTSFIAAVVAVGVAGATCIWFQRRKAVSTVVWYRQERFPSLLCVLSVFDFSPLSPDLRPQVAASHSQEAMERARERGRKSLGRSVLYCSEEGGPCHLRSQVGGHSSRQGEGMLRYQDWVLKPLQGKGRGAREVAFYEAVAENVAVRGFRKALPGYFGVVSVEWDDKSRSEVLVLEDITAVAPGESCCVADIKIGRETFKPGATEEKKGSELRKYPGQAATGFRFCGLQVWDGGEQIKLSKHWGRALPPEDIGRGFVRLFHVRGALRHQAVAAALRQVELLWAGLSSVEAETQLTLQCASLLVVHHVERSATSVRVIDFAHSTCTTSESRSVGSGAVTPGFMYGIANVMEVLRELALACEGASCSSVDELSASLQYMRAEVLRQKVEDGSEPHSDGSEPHSGEAVALLEGLDEGEEVEGSAPEQGDGEEGVLEGVSGGKDGSEEELLLSSAGRARCSVSNGGGSRGIGTGSTSGLSPDSGNGSADGTSRSSFGGSESGHSRGKSSGSSNSSRVRRHSSGSNVSARGSGATPLARRRFTSLMDVEGTATGQLNGSTDTLAPLGQCHLTGIEVGLSANDGASMRRAARAFEQSPSLANATLKKHHMAIKQLLALLGGSQAAGSRWRLSDKTINAAQSHQLHQFLECMRQLTVAYRYINERETATSATVADIVRNKKTLLRLVEMARELEHAEALQRKRRSSSWAIAKATYRGSYQSHGAGKEQTDVDRDRRASIATFRASAGMISPSAREADRRASSSAVPSSSPRDQGGWLYTAERICEGSCTGLGGIL
ncbi:unnamed protein product [Chrysoparadoxa australica]